MDKGSNFVSIIELEIYIANLEGIKYVLVHRKDWWVGASHLMVTIV